MKTVLAIILAAGRGTRAGAGIPKTYRKWGDAPILRHSVLSFLDHPRVSQVQIVIHPDDLDLYQQAVGDLDLPKPIFGGDTRAQSVRNALDAHQEFDNVLIHDGARPFVSENIISNVIDALEKHQGAIPALPVTDALWNTNGNTLIKPISRENLVAAQTPQGFHFESYKAIAKGGDVLDDAQAAMQAGLDVAWVIGEKSNRKLTYQEDFE